MPILKINTNVAQSKFPANFKETATNVVASTLSKPTAYVAIHIQSGQDLSFAGSNEPAALCELVSIGALSKESNKKHSKVIMSLLEKEVNISPSRTYIEFRDISKTNCGFNRTTFDDLM